MSSSSSSSNNSRPAGLPSNAPSAASRSGASAGSPNPSAQASPAAAAAAAQKRKPKPGASPAASLNAAIASTTSTTSTTNSAANTAPSGSSAAFRPTVATGLPAQLPPSSLSGASSASRPLSTTGSFSGSDSAMRPSVAARAPFYGALPPTSARAAYQQIADDVYEQTFSVDEDLSFTASGRIETPFRVALYNMLCILTGGAFFLACRWNLPLEIRVRTRACPLRQASHVYIKNHWSEGSLEPVSNDPFGGLLSDAFPQLFDTSTPGVLPPADDPLPYITYFEYRYFKFVLEPVSGKFVANYLWRDPRWDSSKYIVGHRDSDASVARKRTIFGPNAVDIKEKSTFRLLIDEVLHPFFVFQIASIILWCLDSYYYYATCIFLISTSSAVATLIETKTTLRRLRELSRFTCQIRYWRNGAWSYGRSEELVPGDLFELESGLVPIVPCDAILLEGDCIINESMLTGESLPVSKSPATDADLASIDFEEEEPSSSSRMSRFFLFSGTEIIRVRPGAMQPVAEDSPSGSIHHGQGYLPQQSPVYTDSGSQQSPHGSANGVPLNDPLSSRRGAVALVVRTGFNTTKGSLVRSILFPRPNKFKFYEDSFRFIGVLALIAGLGFLATLYFFIKLKMAWSTIIIRALDLITIVVPPALPATLAIGTSFAIGRLRKNDIFCTSPPRVNICGKINVMCFDKTGTLTQEGLDVLGIRFTVPRTKKTDIPYEEAEPHTPLRFSRLYRSVDTVMPKPVVNASTSSLMGINISSASLSGSVVRTPVSPGIRGMGYSAASLSGASVFLAAESGHPNSEVDFPYPLIVCAMATCHSIKVVHGSLMGDPLDLKMFDFTGWHIEEEIGGGSAPGRRRPSRHTSSMVVRPPWVPDFDTVVNGARNGMKFSNDEVFTELGVVKSFEFVSSLRRMSVVVRRMKYSHNMFSVGVFDAAGPPPTQASRDMEVFVKGAPEAMRAICTPESLPPDYDEQLRAYTHHGYRVIACAYRKLEGVSCSAVHKMKRAAVERDLQFLGFIVFENKLKAGTTPVVQTLHKARIRQVMCTGDSLLTSVSVSRECSLVDPTKKVFVPRFVEGEAHEETAKIVWEDVDDSSLKLDNETLQPLVEPVQSLGLTGAGRYSRHITSGNSISSTAANPSNSNSSLNRVSDHSGVGDYELAITGDVFQWMLDYAPDDTFERMLVKCQIFSRMSPDQKHFLVENLQHIGYCVGFCGDGTNDCGALKAADAGLSLSEAEASVAAPFTSKSKDLDCVIGVIREGRVALVTSFSCFKYMALYSLIQFTSVSMLYMIGQNISDFQFMYIDLALIIPIAIFMGWTGPHSSIHHKRPTASLVSKKVLTSLIGQVAIQVLFQVGIFFWVRSQPWYFEGKGDMDNQEYESFENTSVFLVSCFQYITVALVFTVGPPYQESIWNNVPYVSTLVALAGLTSYITLVPSEWIVGVLELVQIPTEGRYFIMAVGILNFGVSMSAERYVFPVIAQIVGRLADRMSYGGGSALGLAPRPSTLVSPAPSVSPFGSPSRPAGYGAIATGNAMTSGEQELKEIKRRKWRETGKIYKAIEEEFSGLAAVVVSRTS
ncbi:hypothetical protein BC831DRAFT_463710 [Entophlyctis helioformis]|nr:hypothetical protein BC831DRAFT_463710 [Entophlyctis helioformis]